MSRRFVISLSKERRTAGLLYGFVFLLLAFFWLDERKVEWDLLGYSACAMELRGATPEAVHAGVYQELDGRVSAEDAELLRTKNAYRVRLAVDPEAFAAQLPFYRGRVLYIGLIAALGGLGCSPIDGAFYVSWLSGLLLLAACARWLARRGHGSWEWVLGNLLLLVALGFFFGEHTLATADALAAALILWGAFFLLETRRTRLGLVLLGLSLTARTDHIVLIAALVAWCALPGAAAAPRISRRALVTSAGAYFVLILGCTVGREAYGPWTVFQHTFVDYMSLPATETPPFDPVIWLDQSLRSLPKFKSSAPQNFLVSTLAAAVIGWRRGKWRAGGTGLAFVALLATLIHFAFFPALWPRLMFPYWALGALAWRGAHDSPQENP